MIFYYEPTQVKMNYASGKLKSGMHIRIGGIVVKDSLKKLNNTISFTIADNNDSLIKVEYQGVVPDLFEENKGAIVEGIFENLEIFKADVLLAKHDENYSPPSKSDELKS